MNRVAEFFDREADGYGNNPRGFRPRHREIARKIEAGIHGRVASLGGPWLEARFPDAARVAVFDISFAMLAKWKDAPIWRALGDAAAAPLRPDSLDHVVFPLILHHLAGRSAAEARTLIGRTLRITFDALREGGTVWISDFSVSSRVYALQNFAAPVTRRLLSLAGVPLVLMHPEHVFRELLNGAGFEGVISERVRPPDENRWELLQPVIGLKWLLVPKALYPIRNILVRGTKPSRRRDIA